MIKILTQRSEKIRIFIIWSFLATLLAPKPFQFHLPRSELLNRRLTSETRGTKKHVGRRRAGGAGEIQGSLKNSTSYPSQGYFENNDVGGLV